MWKKTGKFDSYWGRKKGNQKCSTEGSQILNMAEKDYKTTDKYV